VNYETFALTQSVFHVLQTDFGFQHIVAIGHRKPKYRIDLRRPA
jgi:hypothetical protein